MRKTKKKRGNAKERKRKEPEHQKAVEARIERDKREAEEETRNPGYRLKR